MNHLKNTEPILWMNKLLQVQQMHFGFMDVILLHCDHQRVSATHVAILIVPRTKYKYN
jgi:hypothetical protein